MLRRRFGRRIASVVALAVWGGFAGGGDAIKLVAQAFGSHGDCRMVCCRERPNASCPRATGTSAGHHGGHVPATEGETPIAGFSISALSDCVAQCALQLGPSRKEVAAARNPSPEPATSSATGPSIPSLALLQSDIVPLVPARAPPA